MKRNYWRNVTLIQNALMFAGGFACMCAGWNDMTRWVFVIYTVVAGGFLAVGIGLSGASATAQRPGENEIVTLSLSKRRNDRKAA